MNVSQISEYLTLIDLDQNLQGFRKFISCWLYSKKELCILIDPGPASTIPVLFEALTNLSVKKIDYILLTHIHIDHAGGTGLIHSKFPEAKIICHPLGIKHMIEPEKLWISSQKVLGKIADIYGKIFPVPADKISYSESIKDKLCIDVIETPGHAAHHLNFLIDGYLFAGEALGVNYPLENDSYLRIATPPKFKYPVYKDSIKKIAKLDCDHICFGHYGLRSGLKNVFSNAREQLERWLNTTALFYKGNNQTHPEDIFNELVSSDPCFNTFHKLPNDVQKREKYFALNSIKGMLDYLQQAKNTDHIQ